MRSTDSTERVRTIRHRRGPGWALILLMVVAGGVVGVIGGYGLSLLSKTNTGIRQLVQRPFGGRTLVRVIAIGEDNTSKGSKSVRGLSDTIMVAAIDLENKSIKAVSIPRDTRVSIPGHGTQKINSAHVFGGPELTKQVSEQLLGVTIDYYIKTNIDGLEGIVDSIGGVGIEIEKDMHYTDRRGGLKIRLKKGYRHLDGNQALQYVRFRHDRFGDVGYEIVDGKRVAAGRVVRQQKFSRALARHMLQMQNLPKLPSLVAEMYEKDYVETDMSLRDMKEMIQIARDVLPEDMEMDTVPGEPQTIGGGSYWIADLEETARVVARLLEFRPQAESTAFDVEVLNGSGVEGRAHKIADALQSMGYQVVSVGNADRFDYERSRIICRNGVTPGVKQLAQVISCTEITETANGAAAPAEVTVIVGKDCGEMR